jgi:hypothetical protein
MKRAVRAVKTVVHAVRYLFNLYIFIYIYLLLHLELVTQTATTTALALAARACVVPTGLGLLVELVCPLLSLSISFKQKLIILLANTQPIGVVLNQTNPGGSVTSSF